MNFPGVDMFDLKSESIIQAFSEIPTFRERLIYYEIKKIGEGLFDRVHIILKARNGKIFAVKIFNSPPTKNKRRQDESDFEWLINIRREFTLVRDNPHVSALPYIHGRRCETNLFKLMHSRCG